SVRIDLSPFTLVAATTRSGLITTPLRDRFGIPLRLDFYGTDDLAKIVAAAAAKLNCQLTVDGAREIARRARGTPRIAGRLLRRVRDFAGVAGQETVDATIADKALARLDVDPTGLDAFDRRYLTLIAEHYAGGPVGIETLSSALSEERDTLEDVVEPYLIQRGLVQRTSRGRVLARLGYEAIGLKPAVNEKQLDLLAEDDGG
ncbi:MAG: Holliday junction DNA helicase RuvB C-terminal domain-containing protein, partial [Pseudomonadota bacterium]